MKSPPRFAVISMVDRLTNCRRRPGPAGAPHGARLAAVMATAGGLLVAPAEAAHFVPASESPAEAVALSVILAIAAVAFLAYWSMKRWRRRRADSEDHT